MIIFIIYSAYILIVFIIIWKSFINGITNELWKAKSVLWILPPELIMIIPEIKTFIKNNSSTVFFSKKSD